LTPKVSIVPFFNVYALSAPANQNSRGRCFGTWIDSVNGGERRREQWEYKATTNGEESDDNNRPWLDGFVQEHGPYKAKELHDGAGLPEGYRNNNANDGRGQVGQDLEHRQDGANDNKMVAFDAWVRDNYTNHFTSTERRHWIIKIDSYL
jgi:hypothetical protein